MKNFLLILMSILLIAVGCNSGQSYSNAPTSCTVVNVQANSAAPNGGIAISCPNGTNALLLNGTMINAVQFCPGTTTYPSTFAEVGFCISGNLWAVYSQNGGFMTEVVPGVYSSDGINSSCTFTVLPNCVIQN